MAIVPDLRINPYITPYGPGPSQEFAAAIDQRIQTFDQNAEISDVLGMQNDTLMSQIAPFEGDRLHAGSIQNNTRKQIDEWAASGDYENMTRQIRNGARKYAAEISPLIENKQRYSQYLTEMEEKYKANKIGLDTLSKAKAASLANYQGYNPNNPTTSLFSGFVPSDDLNVTDKVDKFIAGWKENGGTRYVMNPDGTSYREITYENADEKEIYAAAHEALRGDSDFQGYANTQQSIGNSQRVDQEVNDAVLASVRKYGFYKEKSKLEWTPQHILNNQQMLDIARNPTMAPSPATNINNVKDVTEGLTQDDITGKMRLSDMFSKEGSKYYKHIDSNGNPLSKSEYALAQSARGPFGQSKSLAESAGYKKIEVPQSEVDSYTTEANKFITDIAASNYLQEAMNKPNPDLTREGFEDPIRRQAFLEKNIANYTSPQALKKAAADYKEAVRNGGVATGIQRFEISAIPGAVTPEYTSIKDVDNLANLNGQAIGILSTQADVGGYRKGEKADLNSMLDKVQEDGYSVTNVRKLGPLTYNPHDPDSPGMEYSIILENKDKQQKVINIAANINDVQLQPLQNVGKLAYHGLSGDVDFSVPVPGGFRTGKFRVINGISTTNGKKTFSPIVEVLDATGQKLGSIPYNQFPEVYQQQFAPNVIAKYVDPKFRNLNINPATGQGIEYFGEKVKIK